ncbi:FAD/NAD(P)-binding domain-containing protein [Leucogyrophana mollusca]|uniref:FAD/NAD(P)-binding domain-containing protein n=1 Tax=Leucogyrophana mollusca TaxID=85980 RepID=A0ACB8BYL0_9AGAM|nr:FAD/NAD(P)-binding domain-containing protein [Leucogyrophana mollusca]
MMLDPVSMDKSRPRVAIIGAGVSGITMAINLKNQLGFENFVLYEKASSVGGTWRDNTYPGCSSDVSGHWYSLSSELNPNWDSYYISQAEIRSYWERLHEKHNLLAHTVFNTRVDQVEWNDQASVHKITLQDTITGERRETCAEIVIQAVGAFTTPLFPKDLPGVEKFKGPLWHSLKWRHDVDLKGKRVGVIGNGCSAAQFVPIIAADPTVEVINFGRSRQWFAPKGQYRYPRWVKWAFAHVPILLRAYRNSIMIRSDLGWFMYQSQLPVSKLVKMAFTKYMKDTAPTQYQDALIPSYPPGCKRIIVDPGYLSALHQPNVDLVWEGVAEIVEEGVKLKNGESIPLDIVILGTGFLLVTRDVAFRGVNGITLDKYFESQGGATGYRGTVFPGFPNIFTVVGPNAGSGHASLLFSIEVQAQYVCKLIRPILEGKTKSLEVTVEATNKYNAWIQKRMRNTVFLDCFSYYRGDGRDGVRNIATFPGMMSLFWWITRNPHWDDFRAVGGERWTQQRRRNGMLVRWGALAALLIVALPLINRNSAAVWAILSRLKPGFLSG